jgi:undecaprenyl-phosphate 4-deoxy-4-formamido-L-arabinose transferase
LTEPANSLPPSRPRPGSVSLVIPVFNEAPNIAPLCERLAAVMDGIQRTRPVEAILVNDGSSDDSLERLLAQRAADPRIKVVEFNRNYGQHAAVFAGFEHASGEVIVTLDADLQNPPEEIPKLLVKIDEGYDVVGTRRLDRKDSVFRKLASAAVNRITRAMVGVDSGDFGCMLRAYRKDVVDAMCSSQEASTFIPALAELYSGKSTVIDVKHDERAAGASKYSFWKLMRLHFDLVTSFCTAPLRVLTGMGVLVACAGFLLSCVILVLRIVMTRAEWDHWGQGGTFTLFAILYIFVGVQLLAVGVMGEYVGRIYGQVRRRPRFVVREFHGDEWSAKTVVPARVGLTTIGASSAVNPRSQVGSRPPDAAPPHPRP